MTAPKLFISYSWTTPEHEQWVLRLAEELVSSGVNVILDKWDLKQGHDAIVFMEKMVADPEINKVLMVVDKHYAKKADARSGGVGTEAQIISKEVYDQQQQDKFVALTVERNEENKPYLPIYYKSRIYIDFCESEKYAERFDELLRWIFDKPLHVRPELGKPPAFITSETAVTIATSAAFNRAIDSIKNGRPNAIGNMREYLDTLANGLERFRITTYEGEFDDAVVQCIEEFLPYRNEFIQLLLTLGNYSPEGNYVEVLHKFFERLIPYMYRPEHIDRFREIDWDNFRFIIHELFLYAVTVFLKLEKFEEAAHLMRQHYYVARHAEHGRNVMASYAEFRKHVKSLDVIRNDRLKLRRLSLHADLLLKRAEHSGIEFRHLMQADFVLYLRAEAEATEQHTKWWPITLIYAGRQYGAFEIFARAESRRYFDSIKMLIGVDKKDDLNTIFEQFSSGQRNVPRWEFESFSPSSLIGFENLSTKA